MIDYVWYGAVVDKEYTKEYFIPTSEKPQEIDQTILKEIGLKETVNFIHALSFSIEGNFGTRRDYIGIGDEDEGHFALGDYRGILLCDNFHHKLVFAIPIAVKDFKKASKSIRRYSTWDYHLLID